MSKVTLTQQVANLTEQLHSAQSDRGYFQRKVLELEKTLKEERESRRVQHVNAVTQLIGETSKLASRAGFLLDKIK